MSAWLDSEIRPQVFFWTLLVCAVVCVAAGAGVCIWVSRAPKVHPRLATANEQTSSPFQVEAIEILDSTPLKTLSSNIGSSASGSSHTAWAPPTLSSKTVMMSANEAIKSLFESMQSLRHTDTIEPEPPSKPHGISAPKVQLTPSIHVSGDARSIS